VGTGPYRLAVQRVGGAGLLQERGSVCVAGVLEIAEAAVEHEQIGVAVAIQIAERRDLVGARVRRQRIRCAGPLGEEWGSRNVGVLEIFEARRGARDDVEVAVAVEVDEPRRGARPHVEAAERVECAGQRREGRQLRSGGRRGETQQRDCERRGGADAVQHPAEVAGVAPMAAHERACGGADLLARPCSLSERARRERAAARNGETGRHHYAQLLTATRPTTRIFT
jgi:hypothetical protein